MSTATPLEQQILRETFTAALFDCHAQQAGLQPRWHTVREATRSHWRLAVERSAEAAWSSQFSPLAGEPIPNAPDPYRMFAVEIARRLGASTSRALTARGRRRAMADAGGKAFGLWYAAICSGLEAVRLHRSALVQALPDLRSAA